jgi:hypothetical protein
MTTTEQDHVPCDDTDGVTVGILDGIIALVQILRSRDLSGRRVQDAVADLRSWLCRDGGPLDDDAAMRMADGDRAEILHLRSATPWLERDALIQRRLHLFQSSRRGPEAEIELALLDAQVADLPRYHRSPEEHRINQLLREALKSMLPKAGEIP